jgi:hypothetical protein
VLPFAKTFLFDPVNGLAGSTHSNRELLRNIVDATGVNAFYNQQQIEGPKGNASLTAQARINRVPEFGFKSYEVIEDLT